MKKLTKTAIILIVATSVLLSMTSCFCEHEWKEATCTEAKTCELCGYEAGDPMGHTSDNWEILKEPTCSECGSKTGFCSVCGQAVTEDIEKLPHTPGEWTITKEATIDKEGEKTQTCTVCSEVIKTEKIDLGEEEKEQYYKDSCKKFNYKDISREPAKYKGEYAVFEGEVIQVLREPSWGKVTYNLRVNVTKGTYSYSDTIFVTYTASEDEPYILEDDIVTMYGELAGEKMYESIFGQSITIPFFEAEYIDIN